ncbi:MAG: DUF86 domain-containing protein [Euryarchaeota archaeon]|nr:DUF86 domain-containing protein [Euryarchaeota archaeon]MBV1730323.1 DUF86 domain-containing protein [Methanobacterium sp.]MBV1755106.1 DUF86 domain-containing protein [Methanobacterium sp.]
MSSRDQILFLEDILESIQFIDQYICDLDYSDFINDRKTFDAVLRNLEVIGEAAKNISDQVKSSNDNINWKGMAGMRDKLIHGYFGVDPEIVWETIKNRLPEIKTQIQDLLKDMENS